MFNQNQNSFAFGKKTVNQNENSQGNFSVQNNQNNGQENQKPIQNNIFGRPSQIQNKDQKQPFQNNISINVQPQNIFGKNLLASNPQPFQNCNFQNIGFKNQQENKENIKPSTTAPSLPFNAQNNKFGQANQQISQSQNQIISFAQNQQKINFAGFSNQSSQIFNNNNDAKFQSNNFQNTFSQPQGNQQNIFGQQQTNQSQYSDSSSLFKQQPFNQFGMPNSNSNKSKQQSIFNQVSQNNQKSEQVNQPFQTSFTNQLISNINGQNQQSLPQAQNQALTESKNNQEKINPQNILGFQTYQKLNIYQSSEFHQQIYDEVVNKINSLLDQLQPYSNFIMLLNPFESSGESIKNNYGGENLDNSTSFSNSSVYKQADLIVQMVQSILRQPNFNHYDFNNFIKPSLSSLQRTVEKEIMIVKRLVQNKNQVADIWRKNFLNNKKFSKLKLYECDQMIQDSLQQFFDNQNQMSSVLEQQEEMVDNLLNELTDLDKKRDQAIKDKQKLEIILQHKQKETYQFIEFTQEELMPFFYILCNACSKRSTYEYLRYNHQNQQNTNFLIDPACFYLSKFEKIQSQIEHQANDLYLKTLSLNSQIKQPKES